MNAEMIRVLVVVDDDATLDALRRALRSGGDYVVTEVTSFRDAIGAMSRTPPDVVILDLAISDAQGLRAVALTRSYAGESPLIVIADPEQETLGLKAVNAGAREYLLRNGLYPTLITRTLRFSVESARAERWRRHTEKALRDSENRYRSLFEQSRDAIFMTDPDGEIAELNRAALELTGYEVDELIGRSVLDLYAEPADRERFRQEIESRGHLRDFEVRLRRKDGTDCWCLVSGWVRLDSRGEVVGYQGIIHDISGRKEMEEQLAHEAFHDSLTGLPNRALFMDRLERAVARRRRGEERDLAVLFLDLDRFKVVNDSLGHTVGDELLRQVGGLLASEIRGEDTVARIGGDEYAILLDGVDAAADATHVAERIQERLRKPFRVRQHEVFTSVSIGITFAGVTAETPDELLREADTAMYRAKELGPARYQLFDEAMHAHAVTLLQLETDLRMALEREEFVLHYQPVVTADGQRLIGLEALVRWNHPSRGLLAPQAFLPVAEDTGLVIPLGEWVLRRAAEQMRLWREHGPGCRDLFISVNLSARQFARPDLAQHVRHVLEETGLPASALQLELTESVLMQSAATSASTLGSLQELGVSLCIDDFGVGYSSLSYLHDYAIQTLKVDRSFIERLNKSGGEEVVATILALARNLGMDAVALGVETESQLERLRLLGPTSVQGFLLSEPLDAIGATALIDEWLSGRRTDRGRAAGGA